MFFVIARFHIMDIVSTLQGHTKLYTAFKPQILATKDSLILSIKSSK
ncbi:hypothetical protein [Helicobacter rodentium]|nr:hypothetical protein [Helicobacter rodentium]